MIEVYKILTGKYDPTYPAFYIATLIAPPGQPTEIVHIVPSMIYANTTLRLGPLVSGTASQHM